MKHGQDMRSKWKKFKKEKKDNKEQSIIYRMDFLPGIINNVYK